MKILNTMVVVGAAFCAGAQVVSVKSPDGKNEIRIDTEPVLSYSVYRSGVERVAATPMAMEFEGKGVLGGAGAKIASIDTVTLKGKVPTPIYKKAFVDESANRTTVSFAGDWRVVLVARNDGVAYRFETGFQGRVKVLDETAGLTVPQNTASIYAAYCRDRGDPLQCSWESVYTTVTNAAQLADHIDDHILIRQPQDIQLVDIPLVAVILQNGIHDALDLLFQIFHSNPPSVFSVISYAQNKVNQH